MKKWIARMLVVFLAFGMLAGCNSEEEPSETAAEKQVTAEDYCKYLDEHGYVAGVKALDYVTLPDFTTVTLPAENIIPNDETVETNINQILELFTYEDKEKVVEDGDNVNIAYVGKVDGVAFEGGTTSSADVVAGAPNYIDNFLTKIIGHKGGETFDIECTFPDPYTLNEALSGKVVVFTVTINYVKAVPTLTDAWVDANTAILYQYTGISDLKTVDALQKGIYEILYKEAFENEVYTYLEGLEVSEIPDLYYEFKRNDLNNRMIANFQLTLEEAKTQAGMTDEDLKAMILKDAKEALFLLAICEQDHVLLTESDLSELTNMEDNQTYIEKYGAPYLYNMLLMKRGLEKIESQVTVQ